MQSKLPLSLFVLLPLALTAGHARAQSLEWRLDDEVPVDTVAVYWDAVRQRLIALSEYPPRVWSFDGRQWRKPEPSGIGPIQPNATYLSFAGYDPIGQKGLVVTAEPFVTFPTRTFQGVGAGFTLRVPHSSPDLRYTQPAVDPVTGELMVFGGQKIGHIADDSMHLWSGSAWRELTPATRPPARAGAGMATDRLRNRVVLYGGSAPGVTFDDTWEWDGSNWQQMQPTTLPPRRGTRLAFDPIAGVVVSLGGLDRFHPRADECWEWDGVDWRMAYHLPESGIAYGCDDGASMLVVTSDASVWRRQSTSWQSVYVNAALDVEVETPRSQDPVLGYHAARGEVVLAATHPNGETWRWDGRWRPAGVVGPPPRGDAGLAPIGAGLVLFGGEDTFSTPRILYDDTWLWDGAAWTQQTPPAAPSPRFGHAMATEGATVLLFGGTNDGNVGMSDTWRYNGATWNALTPVAAPPARFHHAMAEDPLRNRVVLFGGLGLGGVLPDTWEWNGTNWTLAVPVNPPPAGPYPAAFDADRGRVVLAGPFSNFEWDGVDWLATPTLFGPSLYGSMVHDAARGTLLLRSSWGSYRLTANPARATLVAQSCGQAPDLRLFGRPAPGSRPDVHVEGEPSQAAFLVYGVLPDQQTLAPGCDALVQPLTSVVGFTDALGLLDVPMPIPLDLGLRGVELLVQAAVLDGGPVFGASLSGRLRVVIGD